MRQHGGRDVLAPLALVSSQENEPDPYVLAVRIRTKIGREFEITGWFVLTNLF